MRRIFGIETEYGITGLSRGTKALGADETARVFFRPISRRYQSTNVFLGNGGRCYLDVGSHPEYATAECDDPIELLSQDRAGEQILADLARQADAALALDGRDARVALFKNNVDSHGNSYGCHENYLVGRVTDFERFSAALLPFLVTRQLICGAGKVRVSDGVARYELSQRADHMLTAVSSGTTRSRPMINTRDEPHADPRHFRRMHVIVGDSNLSDVTTLLKVGSTALVLRVLEELDAAAFDPLALADPAQAIHAAALDLRGGARIRLADGGEVTALDVQRRCLEAVGRLGELNGWERRVVALWAEVLEAIEADAVDRIATRVDWAIKLRWLQRYAERHGIAAGPRGLADPRLAQVDLAYHEVTGSGVFRLLEERGAVARITTPESIAAAVERPPATTRAVLRSRLVDAARAHERAHQVDWATFACTDLDAGTVALPDPFAVADERVDRLIERMAREPKTGVRFHFAGPPVV